MEDKNFDIKRFGAVLEWLVNTGGQHILRLFGISFVAFLLLEIAVLGIFGRMLTEHGSDCADFLGIMVFFFVFFIAARFMGDTGTNRGSRLEMLMLPAGNAEKFWGRVLWFVGAGAVAVVAAALCADTVRWLLGLVFGWFGNVAWSVPKMLRMVFTGITGVGVMQLDGRLFTDFMGCAMRWWTLTVFLLCGVLCSRLRVLTACGIMLVLFFVYGYVSWMYALSHGGRLIDAVSVSGVLVWVATALFALAAVFNVWLSYRLFCRMQLFGGKWLNC